MDGELPRRPTLTGALSGARSASFAPYSFFYGIARPTLQIGRALPAIIIFYDRPPPHRARVSAARLGPARGLGPLPSPFPRACPRRCVRPAFSARCIFCSGFRSRSLFCGFAAAIKRDFLFVLPPPFYAALRPFSGFFAASVGFLSPNITPRLS